MSAPEPTPRERIRQTLSVDPDDARWKALDEVLNRLPEPEALYLEPDKARFVADAVLHEITAVEPETGTGTVTVKFKGLERRISGSLDYTFRFSEPIRETRWTFRIPGGEEVHISGGILAPSKTLREGEQLARALAHTLGISIADEPDDFGAPDARWN